MNENIYVIDEKFSNEKFFQYINDFDGELSITYNSYDIFLEKFKDFLIWLKQYNEYDEICKMELYKKIIEFFDFSKRDCYKEITVELTSYCTLGCYGCSRYLVHDGSLYRNSRSPLDNHIDYDMLIEKVFNLENLLTFDVIEFIGSSGDPLLYPKVLDLIKYIKNINPYVSIEIHTNASLRDEDFFSELGRLMGDKFHWVTFSIDGDEETNHLYRINSRWEKIMNNLKAFNDAGGYSKWKCINFSYNTAKLEKIKNIAKNIGCSEFYIISNFYSREQFDLKLKLNQTISPEELTPNDPSYSEYVSWLPKHIKKEYDYIKCEVLENYVTFVNVEGKLSICTWQDTAKFDNWGGNIPKIVNIKDLNDLRDSLIIYKLKENKLHFDQDENYMCIHACSRSNDEPYRGMGTRLERHYFNDDHVRDSRDNVLNIDGGIQGYNF